MSPRLRSATHKGETFGFSLWRFVISQGEINLAATFLPISFLFYDIFAKLLAFGSICDP
jgi:hypothetical protein